MLRNDISRKIMLMFLESNLVCYELKTDLAPKVWRCGCSKVLLHQESGDQCEIFPVKLFPMNHVSQLYSFDVFENIQYWMLHVQFLSLVQ